MDCANYSVTELRELQFQCYSIALPVCLGIAIAATLALTKVAIVGVTIFVKVMEDFFMIALLLLLLYIDCHMQIKSVLTQA